MMFVGMSQYLVYCMHQCVDGQIPLWMAHTLTYIYRHICMYAHTYMHIHACMHVWVHTCAACARTCCVCVCTHAQAHTHVICTHTHPHIDCTHRFNEKEVKYTCWNLLLVGMSLIMQSIVLEWLLLCKYIYVLEFIRVVDQELVNKQEMVLDCLCIKDMYLSRSQLMYNLDIYIGVFLLFILYPFKKLFFEENEIGIIWQLNEVSNPHVHRLLLCKIAISPCTSLLFKKHNPLECIEYMKCFSLAIHLSKHTKTKVLSLNG